MPAPFIEHNYKKLRLAQDLPRTTLQILSINLMRINDDGVYSVPPTDEIAAYLNKMAKQSKINHYVLKGTHEEVVLFDPEEVVNDAKIKKVEQEKITEVVKIQCHNKKPTYKDDVPLGISAIKDLYCIPEVIFQSGTCVYFLCLS